MTIGNFGNLAALALGNPGNHGAEEKEREPCCAARSPPPSR
ncbi:hypothetical protein [Streptomyces sp. 769]|nr:hypothetical protein [Streptomyces sp. 769]AJC54787.1 hypothetical protein GZL_02194 [Streptomyces sp. 769]